MYIYIYINICIYLDTYTYATLQVDVLPPIHGSNRLNKDLPYAAPPTSCSFSVRIFTCHCRPLLRNFDVIWHTHTHIYIYIYIYVCIYYMNISYEYIIWIYNMNILYEHIIWIYYMNILYEYIIWIYYMNILCVGEDV